MEKNITKLYSVLKRDGFYTKSLKEFIKQFEDPSYQDKVFNVVTRSRLFTKSKEEFLNTYSVKKKDTTELPSETGSSESSETPETFEVEGQEISRDQFIAEEDKNQKIPGINLDPFHRPNQYSGSTRQINVAYEPRESGNLETISVPKGASKFEEALATINAYQIDVEESEAEARLNYLFNDFGFTFEQGGGGILQGFDSITVTAPNGKSKAFNLDPVMGDIFSGETSVANAMRQWMRANQTESSREKNIILSNDEQYRIFYSMQGVQEAVNSLQKDENKFKERQADFLTQRNEWMQKQEFYNAVDPNSYQALEFKDEYLAHKEQGKQIDALKDNLILDIQQFKQYSDVVLTQAGKYVDYKSIKSGGPEFYLKQIWNAMMNTVGGILGTLAGTIIDVAAEGIEVLGMPVIPGFGDIQELFGADNTMGQSQEDFQQDYLNVLENTKPEIYQNIIAKYPGVRDEGLKDFREVRDFVAKLMGTVARIKKDDKVGITDDAIGISKEEEIAELARDQHIKRIKDIVKGRPASAKDKDGNLIGYEAKNWTGLRNILTDYLGFSDVAEEADMAVRGRGGFSAFIWKGLLGGMESLPALVAFGRKGVMKSPKKTQNAFVKMMNNTKAYLLSPHGMQRSLQMSGFIADGINKEIENNPDFAYVSEQQKKSILLPIAVTSSILEVAGFRNLETGTNFTGAALKMALGNTTRKTTAKEFTKIVNDVVTNPWKKGALRILSAGTAEFETGLLQQLSEFEIKRLYDLVNNNEFNTPAMWSKEYGGKVLEAGLLEAIGGAALGSIAAMHEAATSDNLQSISNDMFELYNSVVDDENFKTIYVADLKQQVITEELTQAEADVLLYQFNQLAGIKGQIPSDMNADNKKKAIALLLRKQELQNQVEGKDESLTRKKRDEIKAIDNEMAILSQESVKDIEDLQKGRKGIKVEVTEEDAIEELKQEGVENPSPKQIKEKQDAIYKRSTETLDAQESTEDSGQVGEGVSQQEPSQESEAEAETEDRAKTQEEIDLDREAQEDADLEQALGDTNQTEEEVGDNLFRNTKGKTIDDTKNRKEKNTIYTRAKRGAKFIRSLLPGVSITLYDDNDVYNKAAGNPKGYSEPGSYDPGSRKIRINVSVAAKLGRTGVIAHEIGHAVLVETLRKAGANSAMARKVARRLIDAVYKSGNLSKVDKAKIEAFIAEGKYEENTEEDASTDEERFAEVVRIIATNFNNFSPANKTKVRRLLDKLIDALPNKVKAALDRLGFNVMTATDNEIIQFLQTIGTKIGAGVEAEAKDVKVLKKIVKEEKADTKPKRKPKKTKSEVKEKVETPEEDSTKKPKKTGPTSGNWSRRSNRLYNEYLAKWEAKQLANEQAKNKQAKKSLARRRLELGEEYQMNGNGFIDSLNFNLQQLEKKAAEVNLLVVASYDEVTGQLNGYRFETLGGSFVNPMEVEQGWNRRSNRIADGSDGENLINAGNNILEIVKIAIDNGFTNDTIKRYLKRRNYSTTEINEALKIATQGIFESLPKSFANLPGGIKAGLTLMMKISSKYIQLTDTNRKNKNYNEKLEKKAAKGKAESTWYLKLREVKDDTQIMNEVVEYARTLPGYKSAGNNTSLALLIERDVMLALNPTPNNYSAPQVRELTRLIKGKAFAQLEIRQAQKFLRNFMRSVLPRDLYGKGEVISLIDKVNAIKTKEEVPAVVKEVLDLVTRKANKSYMTSIFNILNRKTRKIESGRYKGKIISEDVRQRIKDISAMIVDPESGFKAIKKRINELYKIKEELEAKSDVMTDQEMQQLDDIAVALIVNNAFMSENDNPNKTQELIEALTILNELEVQGRTEFQTQLETARLRYRKNFAMAFKEVTGLTINWKDLTREEAYEEVMKQEKGNNTELGRIVDKQSKGEELTIAEFNKLRDAVEKKRTTAWGDARAEALDRLKVENQSAPVKGAVSRVKRNIAMTVKSMLRFLDHNMLATAEDLSNLMDRVLRSTGKLFEGPLMEFVADGVRASTREFKKQRRLQQGIFYAKYEEIYGKKWRKAVRKNSVINPLDIYFSQKSHDILVEQKEKIKKSNASERTKKDLILQIDKQIIRNQLDLSQNSMYYIYNQFKDPALRYLNGVDGDASKTLDNTFSPDRGLKTMLLYEFDSKGNLIVDSNGEFKRTQQVVQGDAANVLSKIEEALDDKVKEWADWQVDVYFPSVYSRYNDVYKNIYRTAMPQNQYYAGRLFREAPEDAEPITVLPVDKNGAYNPIAPESTKARLASDKGIYFADGDNAMVNYMRDMEYFAAYAETIRDIHKVFSDKAMKGAIAELHGENINDYINNAIKKIANKGSELGDVNVKMINKFNTMFLLSRLGANLTLVAKQMTSFLTYGNDIGYLNWIKYAAISLTKLFKTHREIMENSIVLQDRYGYTINVNGKRVYVKSTPIQKNVENYAEQKMINMIPLTVREVGIENIIKFLMLTTMVGDRAAILIGGIPNYLYYKSKFKKAGLSEEDAVQKAIISFEKDTLKTQQSYDLQDKDYYQTGYPFMRAFNMFLTTPKQYFRREVVATRNLYRKLKAWDVNAGRGTLFENLRTLFTYHFIMPMLFQYVSQGFPGLLRAMTDEDKEELKWAAILGNFNAIFIYGQALEGVVDYLVLDKSYGSVPQSLPILESTAKLMDLYKRAQNAKTEETRERNMDKFYLELVQTIGIPASQLKKIWKNYSQLGSADGPGDAMLLIMGFSEYMRKRAEKKGGVKLTEREKKLYIPGYKKQKDRLQNTPQYKLMEKRKEQEKKRKKKLRENYLKRIYGRKRR